MRRRPARRHACRRTGADGGFLTLWFTTPDALGEADREMWLSTGGETTMRVGLAMPLASRRRFPQILIVGVPLAAWRELAAAPTAAFRFGTRSYPLSAELLGAIRAFTVRIPTPATP